jgi:DNA helicase-2/ATP-dependent DNA helicase PcrA
MTELVVSERTWTPAQREAIAARGRTLVAAAAGSGKTSVLTELVIGALVTREVAPGEICAVTFTEKAAQEMRERILHGLIERGERELAAELELARIGTIHSLCATILRMSGTTVGVDPGAGVLDEAQNAWIEREAFDDVLHARDIDPDVHWLRSMIGDDKLVALVRALIRLDGKLGAELAFVEEDAIELPIDLKRGELLADPAQARRAHRAVRAMYATVSSRIHDRRRQVGMLSFDDLERYAVAAVRNPEVRATLRARWTMVLVDEFQDTNARQYELLDAIGAERLFMVGDEWQSIYRFRGADVDVFRARRADATNRVVQMRENFRSAARVLDVVNGLYVHETLFGERYEAVIPGTDAQRDATESQVQLLVVPDDATAELTELAGVRGRGREARRVAERIAELIESGAAEPGDIAVLYAKGTGVDEYETALRAWGIPVLRGVSTGFYEQRDVRDVLAVLAAVRNRADDRALLEVLAGPVGNLDWHELDVVVADAKARKVTLDEAARASTIEPALAVIRLIDRLEEVEHAGSLVALISRLVALPAFELGIAQAADGLQRLANLRRLVELAGSAERVGVGSVSGFLEFVDAQRRDARVGEAALADEQTGAVRLMTIHASKGLEFPHVFVVEAGSAGTSRSDGVPEPRVDADGRVQLPCLCTDRRLRPGTTLEELATIDAAAAHEETWRLWYVAMTRARTSLTISGRWKFQPKKDGSPQKIYGALLWMAEALGLDDSFGAAATRLDVLGGLVTLDTHVATREPINVGHAAPPAAALTIPPVFEPEAIQAHEALMEAPDPHALREALRESVRSAREDEWKQLDGTRTHDAVARLLDAARAGTTGESLLDPEQGPWLTDTARERLRPVVASATFQALVERGARSEVPYVSGSSDVVSSRVAPGVDVARDTQYVDAGRIDALAFLDDGAWWVVDWKTTLPTDPDAAWSEHGTQLLRYARAARRSGAPYTLVTLVPLDRPDEPHTWRVASDGDVSLEQMAVVQ